MLSAEKVIALATEWNMTISPSACLCTWVASLWTETHKRLVGRGKTPALAVESLMSQLAPGDKPLCRTCGK